MVAASGLQPGQKSRICSHCGCEIPAKVSTCDFCGGSLDPITSKGEGVCWSCRIVAGISGLILLVGLAIFLFQASQP